MRIVDMNFVEVFEEARNKPLAKVIKQGGISHRVVFFTTDKMVVSVEPTNTENFTPIENTLKVPYIIISEVKGIYDTYSLTIFNDLDSIHDGVNKIQIHIDPSHGFYKNYKEAFQDHGEMKKLSSFISTIRCTVKRHYRKLFAISKTNFHGEVGPSCCAAVKFLTEEKEDE